MWNIGSRDNIAQFNKESRLGIYLHLAFWAAFAGMAPMGFFINNNILNAPEPISRTFTGYTTYNGAPLDDDMLETYDVQYADPNGGTLQLAGFCIGILAAAFIAFLFYCLARFVADPIMYKIDLHTEPHSAVQLWSKRCIMGFVVLLFCATMVFAGTYDRYPDGDYVWISNGQGTEIRVDKEEYEKYLSEPTEEEDYVMGPEYDPPDSVLWEDYVPEEAYY